jgi:hypothetical protein
MEEVLLRFATISPISEYEQLAEKRMGKKALLNGIILIAAAFVHAQKDGYSICIAILSRAMEKLSRAKGLYFEMDLNEIKKCVTNN